MRENVVVHEQKRLDSLGRNPHAHAICHLSLQGTEGSKSIGSSLTRECPSLSSQGWETSQPSQPGCPGSQRHSRGRCRWPWGRGGEWSQGGELCAARHHHSRSAGPSSPCALSLPLLIPSRMFFAHRVRCEGIKTAPCPWLCPGATVSDWRPW